METFSIKDVNDVQIAFEIENIYITANAISELLKTVSGVDGTCKRNLFGGSEYHVEFKYAGVECVVWEPYGDSSRYWIGPKSPEIKIVDLNDIKNVFDSYRPPALMKIFGDVLSLKFLKQ
jgi:hypothetical protein